MLGAHAEISIAFRVERVLEVSVRDGGLGGIGFEERGVDEPYVKDYDRGSLNHPTRWPERWDTSRWGLLAAHQGGRHVGGAVIAVGTADLWMLEGRPDLAVLWDLRVAQESRQAGIGAKLFRAAEGWARDRGCRQLKIETQNVNVPANHFYRRMGCELGGVNRFAYPDRPEETQLLWYKDL